MPEKDPNQQGTVEENKRRASPWPTQEEESGTGLVTHWEEAMTALPNKCYSGHYKATEKEDDQETHGKEIWRGRCGQRASGLAGGRWRRQHKTELDGDKWSVAYAPLGATGHKSSKSSQHTTAPVNHTRPSPRRHSPDGATRARMQTSNCSLLLIYWPRKDERPSWFSWLTCSWWFTHISGHPSAAYRVPDKESSPSKDRRSATVPRCQLVKCSEEIGGNMVWSPDNRHTASKEVPRHTESMFPHFTSGLCFHDHPEGGWFHGHLALSCWHWCPPVRIRLTSCWVK